MDVGDATLFGQHALAYAVLAYAAEYFRRRVLRFPLWQQAAQVAVLLVLCAALVLLVRFVGGAPLPRWTYARAAAGRRAAVAAGVGRCCSGRSGRRARRRSADARTATPRWPAASCSPRAAAATRGDAGFGAPELAQPGARAVPVPPPAGRRRRAGARWRSAGCSARFVYLQVVQHEHYQTLAETNRIAIVPDRRPTAASSPTATASCSRRATRRTRSRSRRRGSRNLDETIDALAAIVDVQPRDRKRFRKLLEESKNFESLPLRTRLTDEEVARFAVNRYRFPGVEIKARLFRQYPFGEIASHVIGYIGRINDRDVERIDGVGRDRQLQGLRLHRQGRPRAVLRARAARHHRRRGGRGRRRRPRGAHAVAHAAGRRQQPAAVARHQAAGGRRGGVRRPPRRAGRDRARDRRRAGLRLAAGLRPQPVRRRHRRRQLGAAERVARQAAAQPAAARRVPARARRSSRSWRSAR